MDDFPSVVIFFPMSMMLSIDSCFMAWRSFKLRLCGDDGTLSRFACFLDKL